ncbi:MAG: hypothetical protein JWM64_2650 [Frankiales bacterium]|nr:hypothetical protein [Frankiales bacterium]
MTRPRGDAGVAALELALVMTLLVSLLGLVLPLGALFVERLRLGSAVGDSVRYASSRAAVLRTVPGSATTVAAGTLPSLSAVEAEARNAYSGLGTLTTVTTTGTSDAGCPSGSRTTVVLTSSLDMGPFAGLLVDGSAKTLSASATSCQE